MRSSVGYTCVSLLISFHIAQAQQRNCMSCLIGPHRLGLDLKKNRERRTEFNSSSLDGVHWPRRILDMHPLRTEAALMFGRNTKAEGNGKSIMLRIGDFPFVFWICGQVFGHHICSREKNTIIIWFAFRIQVAEFRPTSLFLFSDNIWILCHVKWNGMRLEKHWKDAPTPIKYKIKLNDARVFTCKSHTHTHTLSGWQTNSLAAKPKHQPALPGGVWVSFRV